MAAGVLVASRERVRAVHHLLNHLGGALDPHACFLLERGLKTLALRVRAQNTSAQRLAEYLAGRPEVVAVNYPGLPRHPQHVRARELFEGCSGMLSFELSGGPAASDWIARTRLPIHGPSLGGVETLVTRPAVTSVSPSTRRSDFVASTAAGAEAVARWVFAGRQRSVAAMRTGVRSAHRLLAAIASRAMTVPQVAASMSCCASQMSPCDPTKAVPSSGCVSWATTASTISHTPARPICVISVT